MKCAPLILRGRFLRGFIALSNTPAMLAVAFVALAADNYLPLQPEMQEVIKGDPRNNGVEVSVRYNRSILVYDLKAVGPTNSMVDVFRVLVQFAQAIKSRDVKSVELAFRGRTKFVLNGEYFKKLGEEYSWQNPVYTMRTFTENVFMPDGSRAYPTWTGGLLGVAGKQVEQFDDFHKQWYLKSLIAATTLPEAAAPAPKIYTPEAPLTPTVAAPSQPGPMDVSHDMHQSLQIPDWLSHYPQSTDQTKGTDVSPFSSYRVLATPTAVVTYYQDQLRNAGVTFQISFNGIGTTVQASSDQQACVVRINEIDGGASVNVICAPKPQVPAVSAETRVNYISPQPSTPARTKLPSGLHHVEYTIDGSARIVGATYRNATGGTEQNDAAVPANMSFYAMAGSFVYLSAQNKSDNGTVHVAISIDGRLLQQASSSTQYGIATASGSVPR